VPEQAPAISVIMPVYNREAVVRRAIDSVLAQDFTDFELIIVDDGSKDRTVEVVQEVTDPRLRLFRQPHNMGGNAARNRGIREARAPLIAFLDSDDVYLPGKLGYIVRYMEAHPEVEALLDSFVLEEAGPRTSRARLRINPELAANDAIESAIFQRRVYKATPALSARREALERIGMFDETLRRRQDFDIVLRLVAGARCATTSEVLWRKHWSRDSISAAQGTFMAAVLAICERHPQYVRNPAFRKGLARDLARHFLRLTGRGDFRLIFRDGRAFSSCHGQGELMQLIAQGLLEITRRRLGPRRS
jgi:glycosyltransferase involved in cell wall biosynthesis